MDLEFNDYTPNPPKIDDNTDPRLFNIVYADPPWTYSCKNLTGAANYHYPTLTQQQLESLSGLVKPLTDKDCALLLWTTAPMFPKALHIMKVWGFEYRTFFVTWLKCLKEDNSRFVRGQGHYTKSNAEFCLLGVKGKMASKICDKRLALSSIVIEPRREHSRKPDCVREKIEQLWGDNTHTRKLELFARTKVEGWKCVGNETCKFDSK